MYKKSLFLIALTLTLAFTSCKNATDSNTETAQAASTIEKDSLLPLEKLKLPEGFKISLFAKGIDGARSMAMGDNGTLFVGTRTENTLYAVEDKNGDFKADRIVVLDTSLNVPNGVAFKNGSLYVAEVNRLLRYDDVENAIDNLPEPKVIYDDYPEEFHHGWKYIAFGPDEKLYVPVGAPCNICDSAVVDKRYASITRMNADGSDREIYAHGVRNTVGFDWHPDSKELWFTDNGRDMLGDNIPPCELNRVEEMDQHFGYPFCHAGLIADPEFGDQRSCDEFIAPVQQLAPHSAPLAVKFYTGDMFPDAYKNYAFIAEHGSWNRTQKIGYRIMLVELKDNKAVAYKTFLDGWLDDRTQERWGRPVDILFLKDGSMLISDDFGDAIYRVTYENPA
ncbi:PQQ-dependent sugar dehydrogenase [Croceivirga lutea]|uniref:PQQ-dependent sugar dehydrogenase n=1 Tax=Croceivirga lutea TaxID=1775167 RepID=UPI001639ADAD|nr:sorbosone dehydrogenase family protein [Croceivirga lutea]